MIDGVRLEIARQSERTDRTKILPEERDRVKSEPDMRLQKRGPVSHARRSDGEGVGGSDERERRVV